MECHALSMIRNITDEDCYALGFDPLVSHPQNMIIENILVPPPSVRPTIMASEGSKTRGTDDLTQKLQDIVKKSQELKNTMQKSWKDITITNELFEKINKIIFRKL